MDFSPIKTHVQERPCNTLVGICDADHRRPQDVRDYPKSSDRSRLPEGKKTQALLIQKKKHSLFLKVVVQVVLENFYL